MKVNVCGLKYKVKEVEVIDEGYEGIVQGRIEYSKQKILLKKKLPKQIKKETLIHEIIHGVLLHIGRTDLTEDEMFVQSLANGLYKTFEIREIK